MHRDWKVSSQKVPSLFWLVLVGCGGQIAAVDVGSDGGAGTSQDGSSITDAAGTGEGGVVVGFEGGTMVLTCTSAAMCASGEVCCEVFVAPDGGGPGGPPGGPPMGGAMSAECAMTCGGGGGGPGGGGQQLCATDAECKRRGARCVANRNGVKTCR